MIWYNQDDDPHTHTNSHAISIIVYYYRSVYGSLKSPHKRNDRQLQFQSTSDPIEIEVNHTLF